MEENEWEFEILRELHFAEFLNPLNGICIQIGMCRKDEQVQLETQLDFEFSSSLLSPKTPEGLDG